MFFPALFSLNTSTCALLFSLFLQREGAEDILDFWLDVQQHENLCRAYFKDVRKSGRTIREDWPEYWDYARRRGSIYGTVVGLNPHTGTKRSTASTTDMLDQDRANLGATGMDEKAARSPSPRLPSTSPGTAVATEPPRSTTPFSLSGRTPTLFNHRRASRAPTIIPRSSAISRKDLIESAERIYLRYLSPIGTVGSNENHEIYLPPSLRVHSFPLNSSQEPKTANEMSIMAQIPDMFHAQKEYCFRAMEQDAFPRFLRAKAFGNLTPVSSLVRLIAGLIILWIGLAVGFSLIFLDVHPKSKRFFVSLSLASYEFDCILSVLTFLALHSVHGCHPVPHFPPIRIGPDSRILHAIRIHTLPYSPNTRALRQEASDRSRNMGQPPRRGMCCRPYSPFLGCPWPSTIVL